MIPDKAVLCFVEPGWAYFTDLPFEEVRFNGWHKTSIEHNADPPIRGCWRVAWHCERLRWAGYESYLTVDQINAGGAPWLHTFWTEPIVSIRSGVTVAEFCDLMRQAGGVAYLPAWEVEV